VLLASLGGPGFLDGELGRRVRFQAFVGYRLAAFDRQTVLTILNALQRTVDRLQTGVQLVRDRGIVVLLLERLRAILDVAGVVHALSLGVAVIRVFHAHVVERAKDLGALTEQ
jgi:hypothetical protein